MLALAAARLGFKCHIFCAQSGFACLRCRASRHLRRLWRHRGARPLRRRCRMSSPTNLRTCRRKLRRFLPRGFRCCRIQMSWRRRRIALPRKILSPALGIGTAPFAAIDAPGELADALERIGRPAVLKTRRFGYDGKGQATIRNGTDSRSRLARGRRPALHPRSLCAVRARGFGRRRARRTTAPSNVSTSPRTSIAITF